MMSLYSPIAVERGKQMTGPRAQWVHDDVWAMREADDGGICDSVRPESTHLNAFPYWWLAGLEGNVWRWCVSTPPTTRS
jgi:hypothetical protein